MMTNKKVSGSDLAARDMLFGFERNTCDCMTSQIVVSPRTLGLHSDTIED